MARDTRRRYLREKGSKFAACWESEERSTFLKAQKVSFRTVTENVFLSFSHAIKPSCVRTHPGTECSVNDKESSATPQLSSKLADLGTCKRLFKI